MLKPLTRKNLTFCQFLVENNSLEFGNVDFNEFKNNKFQIPNYKQIPNYNDQNYNSSNELFRAIAVRKIDLSCYFVHVNITPQTGTRVNPLLSGVSFVICNLYIVYCL
jgi:hypothetical protein